jgi:hypothetical protein
MSEAAVAVAGTPARTKSVRFSHKVPLFLALAFVVGCRLALNIWMPGQKSDFDILYSMASNLVKGESLYPIGSVSFPFPLPAVLLAIPFTALPLDLARPLFDVLVGWAFAFALWKYRGPYALLALLSGAYVFAMASGQTTPLMVAASLIPALGFLLAAKPLTSTSLWIARPSWTAIVGVALVIGLSVMILPSWPWDWWMALPLDSSAWVPPILRPLGFLLLLAALRWRTPEARLILAIAFIPQTTLPYELVSLALIPSGPLGMVLYGAGTWLAVVAAQRLHVSQGLAEWTTAGWLLTLAVVYFPMLVLLLRPKLPAGLRRKNWPKMPQAPKSWTDRRRPDRLPDEELKVELTASGAKAVMVRVTHMPTKISASMSGPTREAAARKAHDKVAAAVAEMRRAAKKKGKRSPQNETLGGAPPYGPSAKTGS